MDRTMGFGSNFGKKIDTNRAFYERSHQDRPFYGFQYVGKEWMKTYESSLSSLSHDKVISPDDIDTEGFIRDVDRHIEITEAIGGYSFYSVSPLIYIPWMEAILGCPIVATGDSCYSQPWLQSWDDVPEDIDLSSNKWFAKMISLMKDLIGHLGDRYPIACSTLIRGPADCVSAALGATRFGLELYDNLEKVRKLAKLFTDTIIKVIKAQHEVAASSAFGQGYTISGYGLWTPGMCQHLQDDAAALLSPQFYRELFLEPHATMIQAFDDSFYHVHPISLFVVDELIQMEKLKYIEINREPPGVGQSAIELMPYYRKILESGKRLLVHWAYVDFSRELLEKEISYLYHNLSHRGLGFSVCVSSREDGQRKNGLIEQVLGHARRKG